MLASLKKTFVELVGIASVSKEEEKVANYIVGRLEKLKVTPKRDKIGNIIAFLPGEGEPILLNAHMDRVPPGNAVKPVFSGTKAKSDGSSNLGADDAAGIAIILELLEYLSENKIKHQPLEIIFTVQEEIGLFGAQALNVQKLKSKVGIILDNAFSAGVVVLKGSSYLAFDIEVQGRSVHSGKDLIGSRNALSVLLNSKIELGELDNKQTRVNLGIVKAGIMRNAVPDNLEITGEVRSFLVGADLKRRVDKVIGNLKRSAKKLGAKVKVRTFLIPGYEINTKNELFEKYAQVLKKQGRKLKLEKTFVGSDANALRGMHNLDVFVISTGVKDEHTVKESVDLGDLETILSDLTKLVEIY